MKRTFVFVATIVVAARLPGVLLAQDNPFVGTWKLNVAKSKYSPGPAPQSQTQTIEAQGSGAKLSAVGTAADGSRIAWSTTTNYDGKDNPISGQEHRVGPILLPTNESTRTPPNRVGRKPGKSFRRREA
jgi:hypothetical protein